MSDVRIPNGDVIKMLRDMPAESVHVCVTSPPYWGLRAYAGVEPSVWGGDPLCQHQWGASADKPGSEYREGQGANSTFAGRGDKEEIGAALRKVGRMDTERRHVDGFNGGSSRTVGLVPVEVSGGQTCALCGAWRGLLGAEETLDCRGWATGTRCNSCFICHLRAVMAEVWRVLHPSGTTWVNLGDSYARGGGWASNDGLDGCARGESGRPMSNIQNGNGQKLPPGLAAKNLCLVPQRFALAMQADGWWVRNELIWYKKSCMPSSARDRFTVAHEQVWLLSKRADYYFDPIAIREGGSVPAGTRGAKASEARSSEDGVNSRPPEYAEYTGTRHPRSVLNVKPEPCDWEFCAACDSLFIGADRKRIHVAEAGVDKDNAKLGARASNGDSPGFIQKKQVRICPHCGRSDAWVAHYAAFPSSLPRRAVLAGTSEKGCCPKCKEPWVREVETSYEKLQETNSRVRGQGEVNQHDNSKWPRSRRTDTTTGWRPGCSCPEAADPIPCTVLDPFVGSGTSAIVAAQLGRSAVGIDASPLYVKVARERVRVLGTRETKEPPAEAMPLFAPQPQEAPDA